MHPILARYGPFFLYSYTVVMALGLAAAIGLTAWLTRHEQRSGREQSSVDGWLDGLIAAIIFALAGGRAAFVIANWDYFSLHSEQIGLVWQGGLSYHGALLAGALGLLVWTALKRHSFAGYAGLLAPALVLFSAAGWLACYLEGCAYGREATFGFLVGDLPDSYGVFGLRYQTQLLGMFLCLALLVAVLVARSRLRPGLLIGATLLFLSAIHVVVSLFRGDEIVMLGEWRLDTLLDGSIALVMALFLAVMIVGRRFLGRDPT